MLMNKLLNYKLPCWKRKTVRKELKLLHVRQVSALSTVLQ